MFHHRLPEITQNEWSESHLDRLWVCFFCGWSYSATDPIIEWQQAAHLRITWHLKLHNVTVHLVIIVYYKNVQHLHDITLYSELFHYFTFSFLRAINLNLSPIHTDLIWQVKVGNRTYFVLTLQQPLLSAEVTSICGLEDSEDNLLLPVDSQVALWWL